MAFSGAIVFNFENPADYYKIKDFLEKYPGVKVIYVTMRNNERLYISSEKGYDSRKVIP